jgi:aspartyl protease family protein
MGAHRALLMIDGQTQVLAVGASARGVTLKRLEDGQAWVRVGDREYMLRLGASPVRLDGVGSVAGSAQAAPATARSIVLPMGPGGHFSALGTINGKSVRFLVDTGATRVALSQSEASRIGLNWRTGQPLLTQTANGTVPVHGIVLDSVRLGEVEIANVAAVVVPSDMPMVLLGNSFLNRFSMLRSGDVMRLDQKP